MRRFADGLTLIVLAALVAQPPLVAAPVAAERNSAKANLSGQVTELSAGVWLDVPYIQQSEEGCGSASIAMLLQYWEGKGTEIALERDDTEFIQKRLYSRRAHGIFASDMRRYLTASGFRAFAFRGEWKDLREHLEKGRPLIISIQPGNAKAPYHYVVVTGLDWEREAVFVNDPARGQLMRIERAEFDKEWLGAKNWMLLAVPASAS